METIEKTDVELVEASRRGELDAFGHLVARYQNVVCAVGYSSTGDRVLGEDVAQETFIAAWRQLDRVRDVMRLRPWLCGIARNLGHKAKKRTRREELVDTDEHVGSGPSPFDELARGDAERVVRRALARVPETYREVLVLYYREDQSIREVAETLGISEDAVMQRLSRGRRYLADSVSTLVEQSLKGARPRRDLVAAVLAAIALYLVPSRVDASTAKPKPKGSTMLKLALATSALAVVGTTAYLIHSHSDTPPAAASTTRSLLHYGAGLARAPTLGPTAPPHLTAARKAASNDLGLLPADSDIVFGIDMERIQKAALWKMFVAPELANANGLHEFVTKCGFDPLASLTSVAIGIKGLGPDTSPTGTVVVHGFDKVKTMACVQQENAADPDHDVTVEGDVVLFAPSHEGTQAGFRFIDDTTALFVFGPGPITKASIDKIATGDTGLETAPGFADMFHNINSDDPLWFVVAPSSPLFPLINAAIATQTDLQLHALYGSIDITDSIVVEAGIRLASPDQVSKVVAEVQTKLEKLSASGALSQYFDQLDVNADGGDVIISLAANTGQLLNIARSRSVQASASATPAGPDGPGTFTLSASIPSADPPSVK